MSRNKWTYELLKQEALKYNSRIEFKNKSYNAYDAAVRKRIIDDVCSHMEKTRISWTHENIKSEALKYNKRIEFQKKNGAAYNAALRLNILDDVCSHMSSELTQWNYESIKEEALKYKRRSDFGENKAYYAAQRLGVLDDVCSHIILVGNIKKRGIYQYKIELNGDVYYYIGLAYDFNKRHNGHIDIIKNKKKKGTGVDYFCIENNLELPMYEILSDYIDVDNASKLEDEYIQKYKKLGYNILNLKKGGGIGGYIGKYTKEICQKFIIDNNIEYRNVLKKLDNGMYQYCLKNKLLDEFLPNKKNSFYTKEECIEYIIENNIEYSSDLAKKNDSMYKYCCRNNILNQIITKKKYIVITKEMCIKFIEDNNIKSRSKLEKTKKNMYKFCKLNNLLDELLPSVRNYYSYENTKKYIQENNINKIFELQKINNSMYKYCYKNNLLDEFFPKVK